MSFTEFSIQPGKDIIFGIPELDKIASLNSGILTLRSTNTTLLFSLACRMMVRNFELDKRILYLHFMDYHSRFWTIKVDTLIRLARNTYVDYRALMKNIHFIRAFSRDQVEEETNWQRIYDFENINFFVVDSISELFKKGNLTSVIGKIRSLSARQNCVGIILDYADRIHPTLGQVSSIMLDIQAVPGGGVARVIKHWHPVEKQVVFRA